MEPWQEFVSSLVNSLAWPIVLVIVILALRQSLANLLTRVTEFEGFGARVTVADFAELDAATESVEAEIAQTDTAPDDTAPADVSGSHRDGHREDVAAGGRSQRRTALLRATGMDPVSVVLEAWDDVEQALLRSCSLLLPGTGGPTQGLPRTAMAVARRLAQDGQISVRQLDLFQSLHKTRNDVVHLGRTITRAQAAEYRKSANLATRLLDSVRQL